MVLNKGEIITIAAGHKGHTGACYYNKKEEDLAYEISKKLVDMFNLKQFKAYEVSPTGTGYTEKTQLYAEVNNANRYNAKLHLCIHFNAYDKKAEGTETWIYAKGGNAEKYAKNLTTEISKALGLRNRGIKVSGVDGKKLYVTSATKAPCCLIEVCFMDNLNDMNKYNLDDTCKAIYKAVTQENYTSNVNTLLDNKNANTSVYRVICGSFKIKAYALNREKELNNKGFNTCLLFNNNLYKVQVGAFASKENAENLKKRLMQNAFDSYIEFN